MADGGHSTPVNGPGAASVWRTAAALAVALGALAVIWLLARPLALLILAATVAQAVAPIVSRLERHVSRGAAAWAVYLLLLGTVALVAWLTVPSILNEAQQLANRMPELIGQLRGWLGNRADMMGDAARDALLGSAANATSRLVSVPLLAVSLAFEALLVVVLSLYLVISGPRLQRFVVSLASPHRRRRLVRVLTRVGQAMGGYVRGVAINAAIVGSLTTAGLFALGVDYPLALGAVAAVAELIPYIGPILASIPAILVGLRDSPGTALLVAGLYLVLQQIENVLIVPRVMHSQTDVTPGLVIFALACGFTVGGVLGALVAIPVAAGLRVLVLTVAAPTLRRRTPIASDAYMTNVEDLPVQDREP